MKKEQLNSNYCNLKLPFAILNKSLLEVDKGWKILALTSAKHPVLYVKAIRLWNLYSAQTLIYFEVNSTFARINRSYSIAIIYITSFFCLCIKNVKWSANV